MKNTPLNFLLKTISVEVFRGSIFCYVSSQYERQENFETYGTEISGCREENTLRI